jgi:hypothetical protein
MNMHFKNKEGKGGIGTLIRVIVFLFILAGILIFIGIKFGILPPLDQMLGFNKARDLGIRYSGIDVMKIHDSIGTKTTIMKSASSPNKDVNDKFTSDAGIIFEGQKQVKYSLNSEELSALANSPWKYFPLSELQIKIGGNGIVEAAAMVKINKMISFAQVLGATDEQVKEAMRNMNIPERDIPIYVKGTFIVKEGEAEINPEKISIGIINMPKQMIDKVTPSVTESVNSIINGFPGFYIKSLSFNKEKMNFEGTVPEKQIIFTE